MSTSGVSRSWTPGTERRYATTTAPSSTGLRLTRGMKAVLLLALLAVLIVAIVPAAVVSTRDNDKKYRADDHALGYTTVVDGVTTFIQTRTASIVTRSSYRTLDNGDVSTVQQVVTLPIITVSATSAGAVQQGLRDGHELGAATVYRTVFDDLTVVRPATSTSAPATATSTSASPPIATSSAGYDEQHRAIDELDDQYAHTSSAVEREQQQLVRIVDLEQLAGASSAEQQHHAVAIVRQYDAASRSYDPQQYDDGGIDQHFCAVAAVEQHQLDPGPVLERKLKQLRHSIVRPSFPRWVFQSAPSSSTSTAVSTTPTASCIPGLPLFLGGIGIGETTSTAGSSTSASSSRSASSSTTPASTSSSSQALPTTTEACIPGLPPFLGGCAETSTLAEPSTTGSSRTREPSSTSEQTSSTTSATASPTCIPSLPVIVGGCGLFDPTTLSTATRSSSSSESETTSTATTSGDLTFPPIGPPTATSSSSFPSSSEASSTTASDTSTTATSSQGTTATSSPASSSEETATRSTSIEESASSRSSSSTESASTSTTPSSTTEGVSFTTASRTSSASTPRSSTSTEPDEPITTTATSTTSSSNSSAADGDSVTSTATGSHSTSPSASTSTTTSSTSSASDTADEQASSSSAPAPAPDPAPTDDLGGVVALWSSPRLPPASFTSAQPGRRHRLVRRHREQPRRVDAVA
ncbi:hypothetical protein JCM3775_004679 [Rhodotorula graminis]